MIQNDVVTQLQMLIKTSAPPMLEVSQQQLELPQLIPGQKVPAFVVANLPNGRFQVLIADKMMDMNLPKNTEPGDTVDLVFVTTKPRLTFVLASDLGTIANSANAANTANVKSQVSLSETARFLGGLLEKVAQSDSANGEKVMASAVARTTPLLSGAPANTLDFAQALRGAVSQSGLFYESHQAQWVSGQRPMTDLLREPQGRLSSAAEKLLGAASLPSGSHAQQELSNPQQLNGTRLNEPAPQGRLSPTAAYLAQAAMGTVSSPQSAPPAPAHVAEQTQTQLPNLNDVQAKQLPPDQIAHPDTLPLVRQQLEALDSRQVLWQGQVWPGQTMDWRIEERAAREQSGEIAMPEWQTSLRLVLPQLGEISAKLTLHPQGIRVQLDAREATSAKLLAAQRIALKQGMETSGLQLVEMKVRHEKE